MLNLCWDDDVVSVRDQFPMSVRRTATIAASLGVRHPMTRARKDCKVRLKPMSMDLLVRLASTPAEQAISVKPLRKLLWPREQEKLEIERIYSREEDWKYLIRTESHIDPVLTANLRLLSSFHYLPVPPGYPADVVARVAGRLADRISANAGLPLAAACAGLGRELGLPRGFCHNVALHQLATKRWSTDLDVALNPARPIAVSVATDRGDVDG